MEMISRTDDCQKLGVRSRSTDLRPTFSRAQVDIATNLLGLKATN